jgi:chromosome condensin MukBEF MukE localization factor
VKEQQKHVRNIVKRVIRDGKAYPTTNMPPKEQSKAKAKAKTQR